MAYELVNTSAPKGLKDGTSGFCTVAYTDGMAPNYVTVLEALSGYKLAYPAYDEKASLNPVSYSYTTYSIGGQVIFILSRICFAGFDYTKRSNKLAHHLVLNDDELFSCGPTAIFCNAASLFLDSWLEEPKLFKAEKSIPPIDLQLTTAQSWALVSCGEAGWAGFIAEYYLNHPEKPLYIVFNPGTEILPLLNEAMMHIPESQRWDITFNTYIYTLPRGVDCKWRCCLPNAPILKEARRTGAPILDLTKPDTMELSLFCERFAIDFNSPVIEAARTGIAPAPKPVIEKIIQPEQNSPQDQPILESQQPSHITIKPPDHSLSEVHKPQISQHPDSKSHIPRPEKPDSERWRTPRKNTPPVRRERGHGHQGAGKKSGNVKWIAACVVLLILFATVGKLGYDQYFTPVEKQSENPISDIKTGEEIKSEGGHAKIQKTEKGTDSRKPEEKTAKITQGEQSSSSNDMKTKKDVRHQNAKSESTHSDTSQTKTEKEKAAQEKAEKLAKQKEDAEKAVKLAKEQKKQAEAAALAKEEAKKEKAAAKLVQDKTIQKAMNYFWVEWQKKLAEIKEPPEGKSVPAEFHFTITGITGMKKGAPIDLTVNKPCPEKYKDFSFSRHEGRVTYIMAPKSQGFNVGQIKQISFEIIKDGILRVEQFNLTKEKNIDPTFSIQDIKSLKIGDREYFTHFTPGKNLLPERSEDVIQIKIAHNNKKGDHLSIEFSQNDKKLEEYSYNCILESNGIKYTSSARISQRYSYSVKFNDCPQIKNDSEYIKIDKKLKSITLGKNAQELSPYLCNYYIQKKCQAREKNALKQEIDKLNIAGEIKDYLKKNLRMKWIQQINNIPAKIKEDQSQVEALKEKLKNQTNKKEKEATTQELKTLENKVDELKKNQKAFSNTKRADISKSIRDIEEMENLEKQGLSLTDLQKQKKDRVRTMLKNGELKFEIHVEDEDGNTLKIIKKMKFSDK